MVSIKWKYKNQNENELTYKWKGLNKEVYSDSPFICAKYWAHAIHTCCNNHYTHFFIISCPDQFISFKLPTMYLQLKKLGAVSVQIVFHSANDAKIVNIEIFLTIPVIIWLQMTLWVWVCGVLSKSCEFCKYFAIKANCWLSVCQREPGSFWWPVCSGVWCWRPDIVMIIILDAETSAWSFWGTCLLIFPD